MKYRIDIEINPYWHRNDRADHIAKTLQHLVDEIKCDDKIINYANLPLIHQGEDIGTAGLVEVAE